MTNVGLAMTKASRWNDLDRQCMSEAVKLARRGRGWVEPNPAVGAVITQSEQIIARGYHRRFGSEHAEVVAIGQARLAGHRLRGACMYVTLEPCCHWGKTAPCVDAIIEERIGRVVIASIDPSAKVSGKSVRKLRRAGITVECGLLADEAIALNAWFFKYHQSGRPWVIGKWAQTLDGKLSCATGHSQWISSERSRRDVHRLRRSVQAIVTGVGTVRSDDPQLTIRAVRAGPAGPPLRVVIDPSLNIPARSKLVCTAKTTPTMIFTSKSATAARKDALRKHGCEVIAVTGTGEKLNLRRVLDQLGRRGAARVLVEAGPTLTSAFLIEDLLDELVVYQSDTLIMDRRAGQLTGLRPERIEQALRAFGYHQVHRIGSDLRLTLRKTPDRAKKIR